MPESDQEQLVLAGIEPVNDPVVANPQTAGLFARHSIVREAAQNETDLIDSLLDSLLHVGRETKEPVIKSL